MPDLYRRDLLRLATTAPAWLLGGEAIAFSLLRERADGAWPHWQSFLDGFVQDDGRVIDWTDGGRTVSEGQAYALFFALVADDRAAFRRILEWTRDNLAAGDLSSQLPAWLWGHDENTDRWGVLDANPASDADLFIAYTLLEAGRLWRLADHTATGRAMLRQVRERETVQRFGRQLLLPAPEGFTDDMSVRLNPSYIVPFQMRFFAEHDPDGPWAGILAEHVRASADFLPNGLPPDWLMLVADGYRPDETTGTRGSFDAIRCYLWSTMRVPGLDVVSPLRERLARALPMIRQRQAMPESWDVASAEMQGEGPPGFQLCAAAWLHDTGHDTAAARFTERAEASLNGGLYGEPARYYDQVLALFANGWKQQRFRFAADGRLIPTWTSS
ncbi:cellulose synthase complex periplasmic endoglucanase BcsZ [Algiphilus aromaticivorans]|uniref:cellulose synthase complex periplasmic endoglucanase BcsZ n=1 Tax=Algiphilus aromaticivorans TaxID=382454 RepID=UPI000A03EA94|nr:cellulose synthase complex periplasmic endoglucanase BcsZ [Algiphilus aromaticivorans]